MTYWSSGKDFNVRGFQVCYNKSGYLSVGLAIEYIEEKHVD